MASSRAIELNGDEDEEAAFRRAIAMSLGENVEGADSQVGVSQQSQNDQDAANHGVTAVEPTPTSMSTLGLDRKQMEQERLARLSKRKAESISNDANMPAHRTSGPPAQRLRLQAADQEPRPLTSKPQPSSAARLPYAKGAVLRVHVRGTPRDRDITIEEVLQKDDLELAVLSSFQWDEDWLVTKVDLKKTKMMMIAFAADEAQVRRRAHTASHVA